MNRFQRPFLGCALNTTEILIWQPIAVCCFNNYICVSRNVTHFKLNLVYGRGFLCSASSLQQLLIPYSGRIQFFNIRSCAIVIPLAVFVSSQHLNHAYQRPRPTSNDVYVCSLPNKWPSREPCLTFPASQYCHTVSITVGLQVYAYKLRLIDGDPCKFWYIIILRHLFLWWFCFYPALGFAPIKCVYLMACPLALLRT
jgi:hypothetical protein